MNDLSMYFNQLAETPLWSAEELRVKCIRVTQETHDVASFCLAAETPILFVFKPGQFVNVKVDVDGQILSRCYSIATSPARPYSFSITVKRVPDGVVSNWLHDHLKKGDYLTVSAPQGHFNIVDIPCRKAVMLSGGSGITPVMSMVRWLTDVAAKVDIHFIHSARTPQDVIFQEELRAIAAQNPNFHLSLISRNSAGAPWEGVSGSLDAALLQQLVPDLKERTAYVCGPEGYMRKVRDVLKQLQFPMAGYHEESFGGGAPAPVSSDTAASEATVTFQQTGKVATADGTATILDLAGQQGLWIPTSCRAGVCGSCKVKKLSGNVRMEHYGGISDSEIEEGYILACCSYADGDVSIDC